MLIEENRGADGFTVTAYGGGALEIGGKMYREPVVLKDGTVGLMDGRKPSDLSAEDFFSDGLFRRAARNRLGWNRGTTAVSSSENRRRTRRTRYRAGMYEHRFRLPHVDVVAGRRPQGVGLAVALNVVLSLPDNKVEAV